MILTHPKNNTFNTLDEEEDQINDLNNLNSSLQLNSSSKKQNDLPSY